MQQAKPTTHAEREKQSTKSIFIWTLSWVLSLALVAFGPKFLWNYNVSISVVLILINLFFGYKMIMANKQMLDGLDELQRTIHLNAMAISLGVSMVSGAVYGLLEGIRVISFTPNPSSILFVMGITYIVSFIIGVRKYQ
ncbi:MAG: Herpesvirus Glycoprotein B [Idiomarinaceae bacterium HL-53]|nr:MAG: Herpesvirus Glycoprotein B [Idiomarinaceae bacterium HL-53]CUS47573.1 hypothetical protein Ga0003345_0506 [Idiomarinaceae bacterium HL-53]